MFFKRMAIVGAFAATTLTTAAAAADGGALEGRLRGAQIDSRDGQGRTALLLATHGNHVVAARVLIDAGADVNAKDAEANVNLADSNSETPLRHARSPGVCADRAGSGGGGRR